MDATSPGSTGPAKAGHYGDAAEAGQYTGPAEAGHYGEPVRPAGFWIRAGAQVLDSVVIMTASAVVGIAGTLLGAVAGEAVLGGTLGWLLAVNVGGLLYMAAMQASARQASLGKRTFGLAVSHRSGQRLSFGRAAAREAAKYLNVLTLHLGWLLAGVTPRKQALHDFLASTVVVRQPGPLPYPWAATAVVAAIVLVFGSGVLAAIAVPAFLRSRMAGNEASAIGALRVIHSAQASYFSECGAYAISLPSLAGHLNPELAASATVVVSGYSVLLTSAPGSTVGDTVRGCRNTTSEYAVQAAPQQPGVSGVRFFLMDSEGRIFASDDAEFSAARPID
jgi:uncharacterized RDD family membrane protein YckC/type II secretory pathway pseudopilin PulG